MEIAEADTWNVSRLHNPDEELEEKCDKYSSENFFYSEAHGEHMNVKSDSNKRINLSIHHIYKSRWSH